MHAPKVDDLVVAGYVGGDDSSGPVYRVDRATASTAWLVEYGGDRKLEVKARRRMDGADPWSGIITYVSRVNADQWLADVAAHVAAWAAWRAAMPPGVRLVVFDSRDSGAVGADAGGFSTASASDADRFAVRWAAAASWLRAKPKLPIPRVKVGR